MEMEEIKTEDYCVTCQSDSATIRFEGTLRLQGMNEYAPLVAMLDALAEHNPEIITLDLQELKFLNSSGINMLSRFVIKMRKQGSSQLIVRGSLTYPWQSKSLKNLERLMPGLKLEFE
jgi:hypothetical protein